jgi:hypothetical protein
MGIIILTVLQAKKLPAAFQLKKLKCCLALHSNGLLNPKDQLQAPLLSLGSLPILPGYIVPGASACGNK